ncbi:hypothetical protein CEXT_379361, partial [Caerostris extrusa]
MRVIATVVSPAGDEPLELLFAGGAPGVQGKRTLPKEMKCERDV